MKHKLPRQICQQKINKIIFREIKQQKVEVFRASKKLLAQVRSISESIEKEGLPPYLVKKKLEKGLGYGIFLHPSAKPIAKGQVIAPYAGKVSLDSQNFSDNDSDYIFSIVSNIILTKEEQQLFDPKRRYHPRRLYSLDLDAEKVGNFTRFINHSQKPNIEAHFVQIGRKPEFLPEIVYVASKTIRPGEQLQVCYEGEDKSYWGALNIKPTPITPQTYKIDKSLRLLNN